MTNYQDMNSENLNRAVAEALGMKKEAWDKLQEGRG